MKKQWRQNYLVPLWSEKIKTLNTLFFNTGVYTGGRVTTSSAWDCLGLAADKECYTPVTFWIFTQFHFLECRFTASSAWECLGFGSRQRMLHFHFSGFFLLFLGFWVICFFWILYWINHKGPSINDVRSLGGGGMWNQMLLNKISKFYSIKVWQGGGGIQNPWKRSDFIYGWRLSFICNILHLEGNKW